MPEIPRRLLPCDVDFGHANVIGEEASADRPPTPPAYDDLTHRGLIAPADDKDKYFTGKEQSLAIGSEHAG